MARSFFRLVSAGLPGYLLSSLLAALPLNAAERTYKWVDEKGHVHYGSTPPPGIKAQPIAAPPPPPTGVKPDGGAASAKLLEQKPAAAGADKGNDDEFNRAQCALHKKNLETLKTQNRGQIKNPDGSTRVLGEAERAEQIKKAEAGIQEFCR